MKCERCGREATVHELRVVNGRKVERHLCEDHAREAGIAVPGALGGVAASELLEKMVQGAAAASAGAAERPGRAAAESSVCPGCGMSFADFRQLGQLGCAKCYETFETQLGPLCERWHEGGSHHVGKVPKRALTGGGRTGAGSEGSAGSGGAEAVLGGARQRAQKLAALQRQLEEAVRAEQYERAARIRDEIRKLAEIGGPVGGGGATGGRSA